MRHRIPTRFLLLLTVSFLATVGCDKQTWCELNGRRWTPGGTLDPANGDCFDAKRKSAAASAGDALIVSAAAHSIGALGTNWRSDLEVHNLGDELAVFRVLLFEHGVDNSAPDDIESSLWAGESIRLSDVLASEFSADGIAALVLIPSSGRIVVTSRTYNLLGAGNALGLPAGSTFGQFVPALPIGDAIRQGEQGRLIQLSHTGAADRGARTNLGLVNISDVELQVKIRLFASTGELLGNVNRTLAPYEYAQLNRVFERVTSDDIGSGYAVVQTTTSRGAFFAYASVVDNLTGDPVAVMASRVPEEAPSGAGDPVYVAASAHVAGAVGTNWRTDLEVHCWGEEEAAYTIEMLKHGINNSNPRTESFTLDAGKSARFEDVLETVFGFTGAAALRITPTSGHLLVSSRTYNLLGEGNELGLPSGATFGQYIPGVTVEQGIAWGEEGRLIQLSHSADDTEGFRTNLALVNATDRRIEAKIRLFSADGVSLGTIDRSLAPYEYRQLNRVFASVTGGDVGDGFAVVRTTTEGGRFFALASVVDNSTGDPVGMVAPVILSDGSQSVLSDVEGVYQVLGQTSLEGFVDQAQDLDVGGLLDVIVMAQSDVASLTTDGITIDYGEGWVAPDGTIRSGSIDVDTSGLSVSSSGINGTMSIDHDGYLIDDEPPSIGSTEWTFALTERSNGTVVGDIVVSPPGGLKSAGSMSGTIGIDTEICIEYPVSGSLTTVVDNEVITITFGPDCDGGIDHGIAPSDFFNYSYGDPAGPTAQEYVVSSSNAVVASEGSLNYWRPMVGGEEFDETTPGIVTFHFPFDRPVVNGRLLMTLATFHFSYSRGHNFIYGSTDGVDWQLLAELEPPAFGAGQGGGLNGDLPSLFIGETDIWLQARLYSYGPSAAAGGIYCNTSQMSRWDSNGTGNTFELEVELD